MTPSTLHVAIIMDGNGRWAKARGWPRTAGHREGAVALRRTVEAAPHLGIGTLTLYAFSCDNWKRPASEVRTLMDLLGTYLEREAEACIDKGIRISVIGRRDRLSLALCSAIESTENATADGRTLHLRIAVDYSSRGQILDALARLRSSPTISPESFAKMLTGQDKSTAAADLLIRTGGDQRLSDFLL
ncbi:MAG: di-trans,poly-cis-decaprenylcistransferase, partial [bacterium]|nr:di-trans,poly-cis-decaprenylcistransferase [bacterium]